MSPHPTLKAPYASRSETATHPLNAYLFKLMDLKASNLCLSADVPTARELLYFADKVGPSIVVLKTHYDMVSGWDFHPQSGTGARLNALARRHGFLIFEDRKFGDIGNTVELQYVAGSARIIDWAHIVNVNMIPGKASVASLAKAAARWRERYPYEVKTSVSVGTPTAEGFDEMEDDEEADGAANGPTHETMYAPRAPDGRKGSIVSTTILTQQYEPAISPRLNKSIYEGDDDMFPGIEEAPLSRGLLILAQMSSEGNFMNREYTNACVEAAREHKDFVMGFIAQESLNSEADDCFIHMTPGCQLPPEHDDYDMDSNAPLRGDGKGQQYNTPQKIIGEKGSDIVIVGRGILKAGDPESEAERYRSEAWRAYTERSSKILSLPAVSDLPQQGTTFAPSHAYTIHHLAILVARRMGDIRAAAPGNGDSSPEVTDVAEGGDVVLDLTFQTSRETLRKSQKAALAAARKAGPRAAAAAAAAPPVLRPTVRVAYRVDLVALKLGSKYFANLLSNAQFAEAGVIAAAHQRLAARGVKPAEADCGDLPWISITDDDEATQSAGRERTFEDMLRIMHQAPPKTPQVNLSYVATLAIMADRFDCLGVVAKAVNRDIKFKWPMPSSRPTPVPSGRSGVEVEDIQRQKVLVAWLLNQPLRLHQASRELIMRGSRLWTAYPEAEDPAYTAAWWNLPDGLERELQYRRECILNAIGSIQRHFLALYTSKERQCKLGYDSSTACDSFQLGQMIKFLASKNLLFLVDFSPASLDALADTSVSDIEQLLLTLRQTPSYQIDKHHTNCGLRIRIDPILDYVRALLSANAVSVAHADWVKRRNEASWLLAAESRQLDRDRGEIRTFVFTRAIANDQRLRHEGSMYADRMAKEVFTADAWDWTPEA
ncbi:hypothetical protein S40293_07564 [Stachybotrys chartarum IBT 40293]|nr:hypothetical protein S40293_07564 [Stachybotrys chartarum IBT 40293]